DNTSLALQAPLGTRNPGTSLIFSKELPHMFPLARTENLTTQQHPTELIVYDLSNHKAHCLNRACTFVWKQCDGTRSVEQLGNLLHQELGVANPTAVVQLALEQLDRRNLLQQPVVALPREERLSRRDALRKLAIAAAALPAIMTLTAPKAYANLS